MFYRYEEQETGHTQHWRCFTGTEYNTNMADTWKKLANGKNCFFFRAVYIRKGIVSRQFLSFRLNGRVISVVFIEWKVLNWTIYRSNFVSISCAHDSVSVRKAFVRFRRKCLWLYCTIVMSINLHRVPITEESSESENEVEPARIFHRRLSTKNINNSVNCVERNVFICCPFRVHKHIYVYVIHWYR